MTLTDQAAPTRAAPVDTPVGVRGFRPDIQALRALAVAAVVIYHLWPTAVPGGFVGVDVFFVISGFLITAHLAEEVQRTGRVGLLDFWARRIRRLLPAAFVVLAASLLGLLLLMPPVTWQLNLRQLLGSATYVVNWMLGFDSVDYLASENGASLVQHYWSLAVEEQFYFGWPLLILLAVGLRGHRLDADAKVRRMAVVLACVFVVSLGMSVLMTPHTSPLAFFATPLRAWEFGAGGLLALLRPGRPVGGRTAAALTWGGLALVVGSCALIVGHQVQFPGWVALVPVTGAVLCLYAGDAAGRGSPAGVFRGRPVQWLGQQSYAIYLWHWPLVIAAPWVIGRELAWPHKLAIAALTLLLAYATRRFVEDPVRAGTWWRSRRRASYLLALLGSVALVVLSALGSQQLGAATAVEQQSATAQLEQGDPCFGAPALQNRCADAFARPSANELAFAVNDFDPVMSECEQPDHGSTPVLCSYGVDEGAVRTIAVVGNSHALRLVPGLERYALQHRWRILLASKIDCLGEPVAGLGNPDCQAWGRNVQQTLIDRHVDAVVLASHQSAKTYLAGSDPSAADLQRAEAGVVASFSAYRAAGIPVLVTGDVPGTRPDSGPLCIAATPTTTVDPCSRPRSTVDLPNLLSDIAQAHPELVSDLRLSDFVCDAGTCHAAVGGVSVYTDSHHLTSTFSRSLAPYLGRELESLLAAPRR